MGQATSFRYVTITHYQAAKMSVPLVLIEVAILLVFTFLDPNKLTEMIYFTGSDITHRLVCSHETPAFFITTLIYEGGLILVGCVLAYKTRNLQSEFNESKQMIFSMYNTAVISTILIVVGNVALQYQGPQRLLFALGIFWITCFSGCVFVLPRTMKFTARKSMDRRSNGQSSSAPANEFSVAAIKARSTRNSLNMSKASQESAYLRASNASSCEPANSLSSKRLSNDSAATAPGSRGAGLSEGRKRVSFKHENDDPVVQLDSNEKKSVPVARNDHVVEKEKSIASKDKDIEKDLPNKGLKTDSSKDENIKVEVAKEGYHMSHFNDIEVKEESRVAIERLHSEDSADWIPL